LIPEKKEKNLESRCPQRLALNKLAKEKIIEPA